MRPLRWLGALAVVMALVTTACGGDDNDNGASGDKAGDEASQDAGGESTDDATADETADESLDVDNCSLLTSEEVSRLSDEPLTSPEDGLLGCGWNFEGESIDSFSIRSFREDTTAAAHAKELAPNNDVIPIDGVGDEALGLARDGNVNFLVARDGKLFVEMVMTFLDVPPDSPNFETAKELAITALERLKEAA